MRLIETLSSEMSRRPVVKAKVSISINDRAYDGKIGIDCSP